MKRSPPPGTPLFLRLAATLFLVGEAAPFAPATFASFLVMPLLYGFPAWPVWIQAGIAVGVTWAGVLVSNRAEVYYGHDARPIVIDEVAGMIVTFLLIPWPQEPAERWLLLFAGFLLFRVFDVVKPFPADRAQSLPRGTGIMTDDLIAGVYANAGVRLLQLALG